MTKFSKLQPNDGETILHCEHALTGHAHFYYIGVQSFMRPDRSNGEARFIALCDSCHATFRDNPMSCVNRDSVWTGDEPAIKEVPTN